MTPEKRKAIPTATKRVLRRDVRRLPKGFLAADAASRTPDENEFMNAIQKYKEDAHRPFPTWSEVLAVVKSIGYVKVAGQRKICQVAPAAK